MYRIMYGTGAGDDTAETLEEAKWIADEGAAYTQRDIVITDGDGEEITRRRWYGVKYDPDETDTQNPIVIGGGFFDDWTDEMD